MGKCAKRSIAITIALHEMYCQLMKVTNNVTELSPCSGTKKSLKGKEPLDSYVWLEGNDRIRRGKVYCAQNGRFATSFMKKKTQRFKFMRTHCSKVYILLWKTGIVTTRRKSFWY